MKKEDVSPMGAIERRFAAFDSRLNSILGRGRIPRHEKKSKAETAMSAVEDLIVAIDEDTAAIDQRSKPLSETDRDA